MFVRTTYTITELAALSGMSRWRVVRMLKANDVKLVSLGARKKGVLLSTLKNSFPEFYDSLEEKKHLESLDE